MEINHTSKQERRSYIQTNLRRGDGVKIANRLGVTPVWVSYVLNGKGTSEPVLQAAEDLIHKNNNQDG